VGDGPAEEFKGEQRQGEKRLPAWRLGPRGWICGRSG
jgi:hypothetical protein